MVVAILMIAAMVTQALLQAAYERKVVGRITLIASGIVLGFYFVSTNLIGGELAESGWGYLALTGLCGANLSSVVCVSASIVCWNKAVPDRHPRMMLVPIFGIISGNLGLIGH